MSHRRPTVQEKPESAEPRAPIRVFWATPEGRTPAGCCPKCGEHIGRRALVRSHAKTCPASA